MSAEERVELPASSSKESTPRRLEVPGGAVAIGPFGALVWALLGGIIVWAILQAWYPLFSIPADLATVSPYNHPERLPEAAVAVHEVRVSNAMLAIAVLGALVGGALAIGDGMKRRSPAAALASGVACAVIGALFGSLAGFLGDKMFNSPDWLAGSSPLARTMQIEAIVLAILGGGVGLGVGASCGRRVRTAAICLLGGILAGVLAGMFYPFSVSILLPEMKTEHLVPNEPINRLLWIGVSSGLLGLIVPALARKRPPRTGRVPASAAAPA
jgi:hypothetical protein